MDGNILLWIQENIRNPILDPVMTTVTHLGDAGIAWILLTIVLVMMKKTRKIGICSAIALVLMLLINNYVIKILVNRTRPYEVVEGLLLMIEKQKDASFPSGHTAASFATGTVIVRMVKEKKFVIPVVIMAFLISLSRLYVGVHYPTDVLGGLILGVLYGFMGMWIGNKLIEAWESKHKPAVAGVEEAEEPEKAEDVAK